VYRAVDRGRIEDTTDPVNRPIRRGPNPTQTWADFIEWLLASTLLRGNGLAEILADDRALTYSMGLVQPGDPAVRRIGV
jgi:phage portal protein BeeE